MTEENRRFVAELIWGDDDFTNLLTANTAT